MPISQAEVKYPGHIFSKDGISPNSAKIKNIASWPIPFCTKEVQQFLGLAGYRQFKQDLFKLVQPLHHLTEQNQDFKWTFGCQLAIQQLM